MKVGEKLSVLWAWFLDRLAEPTTWQGIAFIATLIGSRANNIDWGTGAAFGGLLSAFLKIITRG